MIKIIHIISGLGSGGAENMLYKLLKYSDKDKFHHEVISLVDEGIMGEKIKDLGIRVHSLNISIKNLFKSLILTRELCKESDIINTWLYHADLFGFMVGKILLRKKVIWNIRHSNLERKVNNSTTLRIMKFNSMTSKYVNHITYNSEEARINHKKVGYFDKKASIISNGFEIDKFYKDKNMRTIIRQELGLEDSDLAIITVGRWNPQKDYKTLIKAASILKSEKTKFKLIMIGRDLDSDNIELNRLIKNNNMVDEFELLGLRKNVQKYLSASDIYVSSSLGESFSNAIGEAMACELPCVVTNVGESRKIIGDTGLCVEKESPELLANGLKRMIKLKKRSNFGERARKRVVQEFDIRNIIYEYELIYIKVMSNEE